MFLNQSEKSVKKGINLSKIDPINNIIIKTKKILETFLTPRYSKVNKILIAEKIDKINCNNDRSCSLRIPDANFGEKIIDNIETRIKELINKKFFLTKSFFR